MGFKAICTLQFLCIGADLDVVVFGAAHTSFGASAVEAGMTEHLTAVALGWLTVGFEVFDFECVVEDCFDVSEVSKCRARFCEDCKHGEFSLCVGFLISFRELVNCFHLNIMIHKFILNFDS